ncbi:MAG: thioredoxin-dependent peroxiredoxin [Candidatus Marinimicrobia bacterium]|jgi:thiol peroxidase|nr:thioredoxin-dependent peroxiredoxin [Candidatus Neomarinimicrobiota bacterium]
MAYITLKGDPIHIYGELPREKDKAPDFLLTTTDLKDVSLKDFKGINLLLNIFPSLDTDVCAMSVRRFNSLAVKMKDTRVLCISKDLPFAHKRFCVAEGISNVISLSELRNSDFGKNYGVRIEDGPMAGLLARSVVIINAEGIVVYRELVPEITQEPDYDTALKALEEL